MSWIDDILGRKKDPDAPQPTHDSDRTPWLRIWALLRDINLKELWPVIISVPMIVFFAISGFIAWLYICLRGCVLFVRNLFK